MLSILWRPTLGLSVKTIDLFAPNSAYAHSYYFPCREASRALQMELSLHCQPKCVSSIDTMIKGAVNGRLFLSDTSLWQLRLTTAFRPSCRVPVSRCTLIDCL